MPNAAQVCNPDSVAFTRLAFFDRTTGPAAITAGATSACIAAFLLCRLSRTPAWQGSVERFGAAVTRVTSDQEACGKVHAPSQFMP